MESRNRSRRRRRERHRDAQPAASGFITVYPDGSPRRLASNLNFHPGPPCRTWLSRRSVPTARSTSTTGHRATFSSLPTSRGTSPVGARRRTGPSPLLTPARILDTRAGTGASEARSPPEARCLSLSKVRVECPQRNRSGRPQRDRDPPTQPGFVTVYPDGDVPSRRLEPQLRAEQTVPNLVVAPVGADGEVDLYNGSAGTVQLVADASGWFAGVTTPTSVPSTR